MKSVLIFLLGLATYPLMVDVVEISAYHTKSKVLNDIRYKIWLPNYGIADMFTENCTKDVSKNGHGWVFVNREYYKCNKFQIMVSDLVFGETTKEK